MNAVKDEDIKKIANAGLIYLKEYCEKNNIRFYLAYGTLIGAVRHQGFIPWDDDIDVWVPRNDYNRLLELSRFNTGDEEWSIIAHENENKYWFPWAKLCHKKTVVTPSRFQNGFLYGISIDIFPLDDVNVEIIEKKEAKLFVESLYSDVMERTSSLGIYTGGFKWPQHAKTIIKRKVQYYTSHLKGISVEKVLKMCIEECTKDLESSNFCHSVLAFGKDVWDKKDFNEVEYALFEGNYYPIPKGYNSILTSIYGNYMELPPEKERISNHTFTAFYL